ncbi:MAG: hypothetical protein JNL60_12715 [Bacteroidia bacterium]|nr:hypothetical protein [Bacteroidia bacterium]
MKSFLLLISGLVLSGIILTAPSCKKDTECKATVLCVDAAGAPVAGANVLLYAQVKDPTDPKGVATFTGDIKASGVTDGGGEVKFTFKLPAILDIKATASSGNKPLEGTSIIKLEEGESVSKTVTLYEPK